MNGRKRYLFGPVVAAVLAACFVKSGICLPMGYDYVLFYGFPLPVGEFFQSGDTGGFLGLRGGMMYSPGFGYGWNLLLNVLIWGAAGGVAVFGCLRRRQRAAWLTLILLDIAMLLNIVCPWRWQRETILGILLCSLLFLLMLAGQIIAAFFSFRKCRCAEACPDAPPANRK